MKKGETLSRNCTAKGKKEGVSGRVVKVLCTISYGWGFIKCHHWIGSINGETCKTFIKEQLLLMFENSPNAKRKLFLQDGDSSQSSTLAREAMYTVGCRLFKIPPRSPDLKPIENISTTSGQNYQKKTLKKT